MQVVAVSYSRDTGDLPKAESLLPSTPRQSPVNGQLTTAAVTGFKTPHSSAIVLNTACFPGLYNRYSK